MACSQVPEWAQKSKACLHSRQVVGLHDCPERGYLARSQNAVHVQRDDPGQRLRPLRSCPRSSDRSPLMAGNEQPTPSTCLVTTLDSRFLPDRPCDNKLFMNDMSRRDHNLFLSVFGKRSAATLSDNCVPFAGTPNAKTSALLPCRLDCEECRSTVYDPHPSALSRANISLNISSSRSPHTQEDGRHVDDVANDARRGNTGRRAFPEGCQVDYRDGHLRQTSTGRYAADV